MTARPKNGSWMADFMVAGTRYREFSFPTKTEAEAWELEARAAVMRGDKPPVPTHAKTRPMENELTIMGLVKHCARVHWSTRKAGDLLARNAERFAQVMGDRRPVNEVLTGAEVSRYIRFLQERGVSGSTINRQLSAISVLVKQAMSLELIDKAPLLTWQKEGQHRLRWFTIEQEDKIMRALDHAGMTDMRDFFTFLVDTGARLSEAMNLRWEEVSVSAVLFAQTKTDRPRILPMTRRVQKIMADRRPNPLAKGPCWPTITKAKIRRTWELLRAWGVVDEHDVVHTFRHTCASRQVQAGVPLVKVKEWMGHTAIQTTLRYGHLAKDSLADVVGVLER